MSSGGRRSAGTWTTTLSIAPARGVREDDRRPAGRRRRDVAESIAGRRRTICGRRRRRTSAAPPCGARTKNSTSAAAPRAADAQLRDRRTHAQVRPAVAAARRDRSTPGTPASNVTRSGRTGRSNVTTRRRGRLRAGRGGEHDRRHQRREQRASSALLLRREQLRLDQVRAAGLTVMVLSVARLSTRHACPCRRRCGCRRSGPWSPTSRRSRC